LRISIINAGSEISNYSVMKILNSVSKSWNPEVLIFSIAPLIGSKFEAEKSRIEKRAKEHNVKVIFEEIRTNNSSTIADEICSISKSRDLTGIFIPESMSNLTDKLREICREIPIEEVTTELFPSLWDVMTKKVATININDSLEAASKLMIDKKIGSLMVMDRGRATGIITEHDFVKAYNNLDKSALKARDIMSSPVVTIEKSSTVFEACDLMKKHKIKKLVIMDGDQLQGIVTTTDIARLPLTISEGLNNLVSRIRELNF